MDPWIMRWALRSASSAPKPARATKLWRPLSSRVLIPFLSVASLSSAVIGYYLAGHIPSQKDCSHEDHQVSRLLPSTTSPIHRFRHRALSMQKTSRLYPATCINECPYPAQMASTDSLRMWHKPTDITGKQEQGKFAKKQPCVVVVLLGWLGAKHKHLKKYAEWYTSQGIHAVTFTIPMEDILTLKAQKHVDVLTHNLVEWLRDESCPHAQERVVLMHMFSNTGWLTYGAVLDRLIKDGDDHELVKKIKGCVVDSAPSAGNDPQVWASGFATALLKKNIVGAAQVELPPRDHEQNTVMDAAKPAPSMKERVLLAMLERSSAFFLQIPYVKRRLNQVVSVLAEKQPPCPQLYIYSGADVVIPAHSVEAFIAEQRKMGHIVHTCKFQSSPHVDHFRSYPEKYHEQLASFLKLCALRRPHNEPSRKCDIVDCE